MSQFTQYIQESYQELVTKVTWPSWKELQGASVLVFVASLIVAGLVLYGLGFWSECCRLGMAWIGRNDL